MMKIYKVKDRQTLADIALMHGGGLESIMSLAFINSIAVTEELEIGENLSVGEVNITDHRNLKCYREYCIVPATDITKDELLQGIEFWGIEFDFEVY